jgi:P-type Ca2+ transporter type 2C
MLHVAASYLPPLQSAFSTVSLTAADRARCLAVASSVLWRREVTKLVTRRMDRGERSVTAQYSVARRPGRVS